MSTTDDVLAALSAAIGEAFAAANLPEPYRDRALPSSMVEVTAGGAEVFGSLFDGDGAVDSVLLGGGETGREYEITHRAEFDWAVADYDPEL